MLRFAVNRRWAFVLALSFFLVCSIGFIAQTPRVAHATQSQLGEVDPSDGAMDPNIGDPDVPITPGQPSSGRSVWRGSSRQTTSNERPVLEGEGVRPVSAWTMRLWVYLTSLRARLVAF